MTVTQEPQVGRWREPVIPGMALTRDAAMWARCRPPSDRVPMCSVGDVVGWREVVRGPVVRATVVEIGPVNYDDPTVWRFVVPNPSRGPLLDDAGERLRELVPDPWFEVKLLARRMVGSPPKEGAAVYVWTKEARLPGSPGWLPWKD